MGKKRLCLLLLLCVVVIQCLAGCSTQKTSVTDEQIRNLEKLNRVWGFAMFTHQSFLQGHLDWDQELLNLIPVIKSAGEDEINDILYEWFIGLGDDVQNFDVDLAQSEIQLIDNAINFMLEYGEVSDWADMDVFTETLFRLSNPEGTEMNLRSMADTSWINESYLGDSLCSALSRFHQIQISDLANAPVYFDVNIGSTFTNMNAFPDMDFSDERYRLLGLFRLWNVMEYYFPYMDIMDDNWHELLLEFIPKMTDGTDRLSYELTLAEITSRLHDAHVSFYGIWELLNDRFGSYAAPVALAEVDGKLVVAEVRTGHIGLLSRGDIILTLNGIDINEVAADMLRYMSYPNDEKSLSYMVEWFEVLRSDSSEMEIAVLRDGEELTLSVKGFEQNFAYNLPPRPSVSHELLDNNIGLINPAMLREGSIGQIMKEFADTDGLIIDLRQYPSWFIPYELAEYIVNESLLFSIISSPSQSIPGTFIDDFWGYSGGITSSDSYFYDRSVVILMNEETLSQSEFTVMSFRNGPNVTVIGTNSIGADGGVTTLPLPGGINMTFTGVAVYTPEGGQTQRIGLSPDIYVNRTIEGIKEGRDELMEAAIRYIIE